MSVVFGIPHQVFVFPWLQDVDNILAIFLSSNPTPFQRKGDLNFLPYSFYEVLNKSFRYILSVDRLYNDLLLIRYKKWSDSFSHLKFLMVYLSLFVRVCEARICCSFSPLLLCGTIFFQTFTCTSVLGDSFFSIYLLTYCWFQWCRRDIIPHVLHFQGP